MNKILRNFFVALMAMVMGNVYAQEVTLDFTLATGDDGKTSVWGFPASSANKTVEEKSFTYDGYTVKVAGSASDGYYWHDKDHYLLLGKQGAYLTLPAFNFDVEKIEVEGREGASAGTLQNIYVGETAVSTQTKGADVTNTYEIADGSQTAGTIYTIKVESKHNSQIKTIKIYKKAGTNTFKWCVPEDFDMTEYHKIIEAKDEAGNLMGTIELLSSPNKNDLFEELKDENGDKILGEDGKPQFDETKVKPAWSWKSNNPEANMSLSIWEEGFGYGIIGKGNPVMSQEEGWVEGDNGWSYKVWDPVYWTPGCGALPKQGEYIKVTPTADGDITVGVFINKGGGDSGHGHRLYIIDESTKDQGYLPISHERIKVKGTFQNNTWIPEEKKIEQVQDTNADGTPKVDEAGNPVMKWVEVKDEEGNDVKWYPFGDSPVLPMDIPMTENYSIFEYTNQKGEVTFFNRPFLGLITFDVKKDITYWMLNPTSQLGFYGFKLVTKNSTGINNIKTTVAKETPTYNLAGQRVDANYKGIVVKNGVKFMQK